MTPAESDARYLYMNADNDFALDFAMLDLPARPGPCRKAAAEEADPVEARLTREIESAPYRVRIRPLEPETPVEWAEFMKAVEFRWGSGKVKV